MGTGYGNGNGEWERGMGTGNGNGEWESGGCKTGNDNQGCLKQGIRGVKRGIRGCQTENQGVSNGETAEICI